MIVDLVHDESFGYLNQYARLETVYDQGSFDFAISGNEGQLQFYPTRSSVNDYDITAISYNLDDNLLSTGSTVVGGTIIDSESVVVNKPTPATIVSIGILTIPQRFLLLLLQMYQMFLMVQHLRLT